MNGLKFQRMILSGTLILALGACAHKPTKTMKADMPIEVTSPGLQQDVLLKEARIEAESLRAELASLKILMAKQMGELRSLREQSQSIQHREQDQGQELQNIRSQLLSSQAERDQLRKKNMELEGQVASLPDTSQLVSDIQTLTGSFHKIMDSMQNLASDMRLIKQEMHITTAKPKPQQTKMTTSVPPVAITDAQTPDAKGRIIIQEGDTLWQLARTYHVSVDQLREWNNISTDLIMTGLRLQVGEPMKTVEAQPDQDTATTQAAVLPEPKQDSEGGSVHAIPQQTIETREGTDTSPTHILSIASPQSDSPGSP